MKKNVYLGVALLTMAGFCCTSCGKDETIVEVEKIVIEKDYTKLSDAERQGLKGNPKTITEFVTYGYTQNGTTITPHAWVEKYANEYNQAGYLVKSLESSSLNTKLEQDGEPDPVDGAYYKGTTPEWRVVDSIVIERGADNRPTGSMGMNTEYRLRVKGDGNTFDMNPTDSSPFPISWFGIENISEVKLVVTSLQKSVITFDTVNKKATEIIQTKEAGASTWNDTKRIVYGLDEFGMPNEENREEFGAVVPERPASELQKIKTRAFQPESSLKSVEQLDAKGNWIVRYNTNGSYIKRDIVYY